MTHTTPSLYSEGEENWQAKLHVGCGGIYLRGYVNIDVAGERVQKPPAYATDIRDYYRGLDGDVGHIPVPRETHADMLCDMRTLPFKPNSIDKIVAIQCLEHLPPIDVRRTLNHWWNILKPRGVLILSVPDSDATLELIRSDPDFAIRHLRGSLKNDYAGHLTWLTKEMVEYLLSDYGFTCEHLPNIHFYPAVVVKATKLSTYVADRSYQVLPDLSGCKRVLDVGPGGFRFKSATHWLDVVDRTKEFKDLGYQGGFVLDLNGVLPCGGSDWGENSWDFVYMSHVFEHMNNPLAVYEWAVHIGKRGYIEVPSAMLDYVMQHGEAHGKWLSTCTDHALIMVAMNDRQRYIFSDAAMGTLFHRLTQYSIPLDQAEAAVHRHFWFGQDVLNCSIQWDDGYVPTMIVVDTEGRVDQWPYVG